MLQLKQNKKPKLKPINPEPSTGAWKVICKETITLPYRIVAPLKHRAGEREIAIIGTCFTGAGEDLANAHIMGAAKALYDLARDIHDRYGEDIENNPSQIDGAEVSTWLVQYLYPQLRKTLAQAEKGWKTD